MLRTPKKYSRLPPGLSDRFPAGFHGRDPTKTAQRDVSSRIPIGFPDQRPTLRGAIRPGPG